MNTSPSNIPKCIKENEGACVFHSEAERNIWVQGYIEIGQQKLKMSNRWDNKKSIRRNLLSLSPYEEILLCDIASLIVWQYRSDRAKKKGVEGAKEARSALTDKQRLLAIFFEGKVKPERTIEELLNGHE